MIDEIVTQRARRYAADAAKTARGDIIVFRRARRVSLRPPRSLYASRTINRLKQ
jgi:hypothetical protein